MAQYNLDSPYDLEKFRAKVQEMELKGGYVELKRKASQRSRSQNNYLHLLLGYFALEFGYSLEQVKMQFFKILCNADIFIHQRPNKYGETVDHIRSSAELTTEEMSTAITRFRNYSASECGLYLPEPGEKGSLMYIEQQMENNKEYL